MAAPMSHDILPLSDDRPLSAKAAALGLMAALMAAVMLAPQLAVWTSGPAWACLALAGIAALRLVGPLPAGVLWTGLPLVGWLGFRAATSPVKELAVADGLLLAAAVAVFAVTRGLLPRRGVVEWLFAGLGLLVVANVALMIQQAGDPTRVMILPRGTETFPSGFFGYYGDCAAFLLAVALLAGGLAWDGRRAKGFRIAMVLVALVAAAGVVLSRSRGGILGLGAGAALLLVLAPWLTLPPGSRWRGVMALALPLATVAGLLVLGSAFSEAQELRGVDAKPGALGDNNARLFWWQLAAAGISQHPWTGGGSRSFSWESFAHWDGSWEKFSTAKPEFAHNEFLQLAHDYGLTGLLLAVAFFIAVAVAGITGRWSGPAGKAGTAVMLGGIAAMVGLLAHGALHFVFHIPPAALLLGMALAFALETARPARRGGIPAAVATAAAVAVLALAAWPALRVFRELAPVVYRFGGPRPDGPEALARLDRATRAWPLPSLLLQHGKLCQVAAATAEPADRRLLLEQAEASFRAASASHPHDPEASVNLANVLSALERDDEAAAEFDRAIRLQGGLEWGFRARYSAAAHHFRLAERHRAAGDTAAALADLLRARDRFDSTVGASAGDYGVEGRQFRIALALHLGPRLESLARHEEAAAEYERALRIPGSQAIPYPAARNLLAWGDAIWLERRPEEALAKFQQAWNLANLARTNGFDGYPRSELDELMRRITAKIDFLRGAGIRPPASSSGP
jgi:O-antigen ligase/tetratricopeptide (TPR) repeat protein